jgi:hypothetical protein
VEFLREVGFPAQHADALGHTVALDLTATGSVQGDALSLSNAINGFSTVASGTGAVLPNVDLWKPAFCVVYNSGLFNLKVYPYPGQYIYPFAINAPLTIAGGAGNATIYSGVRPNGQRVWVIGAYFF